MEILFKALSVFHLEFCGSDIFARILSFNSGRFVTFIILCRIRNFWGVLAVLNRYSNRLEIWRNRIVLVKGIIARDEVEISIPNIRTFRIEQSICQRLLRIGNIYIASAGTTDYEEKIFGVSDPKKVKRAIFENLE